MKVGVPAGALNSVPQALGHAHSEHRAMVVRRGTYQGLRSPMVLCGTPAEPGNAPPEFAQDSDALLEELGFNPMQRHALYQAGAVLRPAGEYVISDRSLEKVG